MRKLTVLIFGCAGLAACTSVPPSRPVSYQDVNSAGIVAGVGVESQDITSVTDAMVKDLLANPAVMKHDRPPRVVLDSEYFENKSMQRLNKDTIVDRLRINFQRAAQGKLVFLSRQSAGMVAKERELKRAGLTDTGTKGLTHAQAGADYYLTGRIHTVDARSAATGMVERYTQIIFELIDVESSVSIWSNIYEFKKGGLDDAVYR